MKKENRGLTIIALLAVYVFWGGTYLGMKIALGSFPPFLMAGIRHLSAGLIMFTIGFLKHETRPTKSQIMNAGVVGLLLLVGGNGLVAWSEQRLPSAIASLVITSVPFWIMGMNWLGGDKQKPKPIEIVSLIMGFSGIMLMVFQGNNPTNERFDVIGLVVLFIAAFLWSLGSLYSRHRKLPGSSIYSTATQMLAGGSSLLILSFSIGEAATFNASSITTQALFAMGYLILFGSVIAYTAYIWLMKNVAPALASTYAFVNPVVAVLLGWTIAGEVLSGQTLIAAAIIISAVGILTLSKKAPKGH